MSEDWDEPEVQVASAGRQDEQLNTGGRSFGKGRGFTPHVFIENKNDSGWNTDGGFKNDWGGAGGNDRGWRGGRGGAFSNDGDDRRERRGGGGDRGGRGSRGGGGGGDRTNGRHNRRDDEDDSYASRRSNGGSRGWNNNKENDDWNGSSDRDKPNDAWSGNKGDSWNANDDNRGRGGRGRTGNSGHGARDRNSERDCDNDDDGEKKDERPPIYVPKERTEEELFEDAGISKGINFDNYKSIAVSVTGNNVPPPISSFVAARFRSLIMDNLKRTKYDEPTPIQKYAIPIILNGRDLMATAQTGSGKTAAFLLPIIHNLLEKQREEPDGSAACQPNAIILSPTRELTTQIYEVARKFCTNSFLKVHQIYGGTSVGYQIKQVSNGCHILIATPGRLGHFLERGIVSFTAVKFFVLDEADRMLDLGFRSEIEKFFKHETMRSSGRQTLMFSATFSTDIQKLAYNYLDDYLFLSVGIVGGACTDVEQNFIAVARNDKKKTLVDLLASEEDVRGTLLFVGTKRNADFVASYLSGAGHPTTSIHGDRFQSQREEALFDFKTRRMSILVATAVAARGLDIEGVKHVINYDLPDSIDEYVHRIGRTGRLGNKGRSTSFYDCSQDKEIVNHLVNILKQAGQPIPDFLSRDATGSSSFGEDEFGGYDYRSNKDADDFKTNSSNIPTQIQEEESW